MPYTYLKNELSFYCKSCQTQFIGNYDHPPPPGMHVIVFLDFSKSKNLQSQAHGVYNLSTWEITQGYIGKSPLLATEVDREERRRVGWRREGHKRKRNVKEKRNYAKEMKLE